ncbi:hypothetical protein HG530_003089 [Fusarium avenaceum]|nr:hypothetical protein HG530_003089 [Fusarium avenaceum]
MGHFEGSLAVFVGAFFITAFEDSLIHHKGLLFTLHYAHLDINLQIGSIAMLRAQSCRVEESRRSIRNNHTVEKLDTILIYQRVQDIVKVWDQRID